MNIQLLVDSADFWSRLQTDLSEARSTAYLQTFSFEGDGVGCALGRRLLECAATDRRLLVDGYSRLFQNDRLIPGPAWLSSGYRREARMTRRWVRRLRAAGAGVRFGNPLGPSPVRLLRRNHKKLAVFDDRVAYLGGINFCDHNFQWHDMMLRVEDESLAAYLAEDFRSSWRGRPQAGDRTFGDLRVISLNGRGNPAGFAPVVDLIHGARGTIDVVSAYLSPPFTGHLAAATRRGVRVRLLTPERNNKSNLARHALASARRFGFEVLRYPDRMNHMKAMVVDDEALVVGSTNFDFMSYHVLEELFVITRDPGLVEAFRRQVWTPDVAVSRRLVPVRSAGLCLGDRAVAAGAALAPLFALP